MFRPRRKPQNFSFLLILFIGSIFILKSCDTPPDQQDPEARPKQLKREIRTELEMIRLPGRERTDYITLHSAESTQEFYSSQRFEPQWVKADSLTPRGDSLIQLTQAARRYGLFPEHYHAPLLASIRSAFEKDTLGAGPRKDLKQWARMDILLTDAFLTLARHLHRGHLPLDSLEEEETYAVDFYFESLTQAVETNKPVTTLESLEPRSYGYQELKKSLPDFLRRAKLKKEYTYVQYPFQDSLLFIRSLLSRLREENYIDSSVQEPDSLELSALLKKVQTSRGLKVDGKYGPQLIGSLNNNDVEKFYKAAINLDRYRMQTDTLPEQYLLVNLPAFELSVFDHDTVKLESRVIVGKPKTPTPLLSSRMGQLIVYPTWTIPASIVADEILPALKRNPGYLAKKGYNLYDLDGNEVDPYTVNWSRYKKGIPYKIVQGEGIGNALGIMKFNFPNEHFVYLHDTNQRSLFQNENRALSHGCVRVQNWQGLYHYLLQLDSIGAAENQESFVRTDSVRSWLKQEKRRVIPLKSKLPIFFRYYTAAGKKGKLEVYNDVYGQDQKLREQLKTP